jgi:hypothetical protein
MNAITQCVARGNHLAAQNDEPEPRYIRTPEHDFTAGPNSMGGNAWFDVVKKKTRLFRKGYDANDSWCGSDLARRKAIDGGKK